MIRIVSSPPFALPRWARGNSERENSDMQVYVVKVWHNRLSIGDLRGPVLEKCEFNSHIKHIIVELGYIKMFQAIPEGFKKHNGFLT